MRQIILAVMVFACVLGTGEATEYRKHRVNIKPLSATKFELTDINFENPKIVDLKGKDFFAAFKVKSSNATSDDGFIIFSFFRFPSLSITIEIPTFILALL